MQACLGGHAEVASLLLNHPRMQLHMSTGPPPRLVCMMLTVVVKITSWLVRHGSVSIKRWLLTAGNTGGDTALMFAAKEAQGTHLVRLLVEAGAAPTQTTKVGFP